MMNIRSVNLRKLNSLTKYPSIPTYHKLGEKGILTEEVQVDFANFADGMNFMNGFLLFVERCLLCVIRKTLFV